MHRCAADRVDGGRRRRSRLILTWVEILAIAADRCRGEHPAARHVGGGHHVACHLYD